MRPSVLALLVGLPLAALAGVLASTATREAKASPAVSNAVLVELFTSEGCSSCPPADAVVAKLGTRAIVLGHHVDYWNNLGWPDPFSSPEATARQRAYAPLGSGSYTPQVVIDGQAETVGSRASAIEDAIATSAKRPHVSIDVVQKDGELTIRVGYLPEGALDAELLVAIVQDHARVAVPRGENAGKTLDHVAIVRSLRPLGNVPLAGSTYRATVKTPTATAGPSAFSVVAFVQERGRRRVLGATSVPLP